MPWFRCWLALVCREAEMGWGSLVDVCRKGEMLDAGGFRSSSSSSPLRPKTLLLLLLFLTSLDASPRNDAAPPHERHRIAITGGLYVGAVSAPSCWVVALWGRLFRTTRLSRETFALSLSLPLCLSLSGTYILIQRRNPQHFTCRKALITPFSQLTLDSYVYGFHAW